jgi:hypothetical protein
VRQILTAPEGFKGRGQDGRYAGRADEAVRLDAQILFGLIVLPPLRRAMLESAGEPVDCALLDRAIDIFVAGAMGEGSDRFSPPGPLPAP